MSKLIEISNRWPIQPTNFLLYNFSGEVTNNNSNTNKLSFQLFGKLLKSFFSILGILEHKPDRPL
jgi:hypothetical protein